MKNSRVAVLRGGPSEEYEVSLKTGAAVVRALKNMVADIADILITKQGEWIRNGRSVSPSAALVGVDRVFVALHGAYGEDGEIQKFLQRLQVPFTGSRSLPSAIAFNKDLTKKSLARPDLQFYLPAHTAIARDQVINLFDILRDLESKSDAEYFIIKPNTSGSSVGIELATRGESLATLATRALATYEQIIVEEFIKGREATCAVIENFRVTPVYSFPVIEIIPPCTANYFSNEVKYNGTTQKICPGNFSYQEREQLQQAAKYVHEQLHLSQYSRSDFIVRNGKIYFLEVNTLPGLTAESLFPQAAAAVGLSFPDLVEILVKTARI